ncbi:DUF5812 family protein [Haloarcula marismortui]|uniref:Uncharacterized protein n=1 Tax=Haloarcula marismortui ATCC 33800 TaxID=662476 RepID=M0JUN1_9EURY|nr:DUF5812 family protein [Haloarcula sinaiiensis]EMA12078.1 hypothetical protein C436_14699 [Haloarcula sinaiiensis ATCC 33800]QUJ71309.1 hypothetical protein KDQ40_11385 [Haloarcula sinaiiensis ATCC 33800]
MTAIEGTFLVTNADDGSATLRNVADSQVLTLSDNPGVEAGEVVEGTVEPEPPMEVTYTVTEVAKRRTIPVETVDLAPTAQTTEIAAEQAPGELTTVERAGEGEVHVLTVPEDETAEAATDVVEDEATLSRAARLGVDRVEVRTAAGVVSVRYLPD